MTDIQFPIGCKVYYHPSETAFSANTDFVSKKFYSTYKEVDARYSSVTGSSLILGSSSTSTVYLHVLVDNGYWKPYYKAGATNEIIVSSNQLQSGNFYIYLGKKIGTDAYTFQLEDNNPLYYYDGTKLIDWATYQVGMSTPSYTAGEGIGILNNVITHKGWSYTQVLPQDVSINNTASFGFNFTGQSADAPVAGTYVVSAQALVSNPNNIGNQAHFALRYRIASSGGYTIAAATSVTLAPARSSAYGGTYGATHVNLQGMLSLSERPSYLEVVLSVEVETDGNESTLVSAAPLSGSNMEALDPGVTNIIMYRIGE